VRRQSKKSNTLKVLTAAAVVAAMSTGSLTAFASTNDRVLVDVGGGNIRELTVEQLSNDYYRNLVINAFNTSNPILVQQEDGTWNEVSENATVEGIADALEDYAANGDPDSPFQAYIEG